ncbi:hypothetical protein TNCV_3789421 [Trichonephila clavipes]|nr:hypothetical protein TNCV_3789421 [Trichonephila clavipes]
MYSSALSIEIISDVEFSRRLVESRSDKLKQVKSCRKKNNSTRPLNSKIKANAGEKQLNSSVGTKQLHSAAGTKQLNSPVGTKQLNSSVGTKQLNSCNCTAVDRLQPPTTPTTAYNAYNRPPTAYNRLQRLQPPATAYNRLHRLYSRIGFFYLLSSVFFSEYTFTPGAVPWVIYDFY